MQQDLKHYKNKMILRESENCEARVEGDCLRKKLRVWVLVPFPPVGCEVQLDCTPTLVGVSA